MILSKKLIDLQERECRFALKTIVSFFSKFILAFILFFRLLSIDWCHLVDRHRPTAWDTTRKLVVLRAVGTD